METLRSPGIDRLWSQGWAYSRGLLISRVEEDEEDHYQTNNDSKQPRHYTDEIMVISTADTRLSQAQNRHNPSMNGGRRRGHKILPLAENLWAFDSNWGREN